MPPGINAGKVKDLTAVCQKLGIDDGELAAMKIVCLISIWEPLVQDGKSPQEIASELLNTEEIQYHPDTLYELIDCMVHNTLTERMAEVLKGIDNSLLT